MLIQTLCEYYDINRDKIFKDIPNGFEEIEISHMIFLTPDGKISSIKDIRKKSIIKKNGKAKETLVKQKMAFPKRSQKPGIDLNIAEHRALYIFGLNYDKNAGAFTPDDKTQKAYKSHKCFVEGSLKFCEELDSPIVNAFKAFLLSWNPIDEVDNPNLKNIEKEYSNASYCFALDGHPDILLHEDNEFKKKYSEQIEQKETLEQTDKPVAMCPVEGKILPVARIHEQIKKGIKGGSAMGMALVGYNEEAFESYQKKQSYNSNISENAMMKYTSIMNYLLTNSEHHFYLDDMTLFYFALSSDDTKECNYLQQYFNPSNNNSEEETEDTETIKGIHNTVKSMKEGIAADIDSLDLNADFIIAGVTPNSSRIAVKFLLRRSFGSILEKLIQHQKDIQTYEDEPFIPMWRIFKELVPPKEKDATVPPPLQSNIILAALNGTRYPDAMLHTVLHRVKVDENMGYNYGTVRIGLIKAYLNRKARLSNNKEEITLALDLENKNPAYLCGRLFATLEQIQQKAYGDSLNRTIKDSFFASACARPVSVFPKLLKLSQNHLAKLDKNTFWQKLIGEIISDIGTQFPSTMSPDEQGKFIIGYYQQRQEFFTKQSDKTQTEDETGKED